MANEDKKDFNAMLHDSKDMPKFQIITDQKSIEKYGGSRMYFAPPIVFVKRKCEQKGPKKVSTFSTRFHVVSNVFPKYQMLTF